MFQYIIPVSLSHLFKSSPLFCCSQSSPLTRFPFPPTFPSFLLMSFSLSSYILFSSLISCRGGPGGRRFSCNAPTSGEQDARSPKRPAKLYVLFPLSVFLFHSRRFSVALITFCFTREAVSSVRSRHFPTVFFFLFVCFVKELVPLKYFFVLWFLI